ncbi:conserved hypothetical protein [Paraburkholderia piptadeniae]|uniref:MmgE/PrpD family protein n=1 Tax=Paraburkholderia piptadeniae TaxID=1701573 RepID=A0A1N7SPS4_9BURK|nr:MmgE/PrpD family protein [Paraburkholderia piptadeniae]SIT49425.1 conserved hypothetical protein [Paraburkholderia piptadeniae]
MLAHDLAALALRLRPQVYEPANRALIRQCLIDAAAAALAGYDSPVASIAVKFAVSGLGPGVIRPWLLDDANLTPMGAAFVNSSVMSALDIDDGNRAARGHLGAAVVPAASVFGALRDASAETFAHAILAGCEIGARLGAAEAPPYFASGRWAGVGAAIATGICRGLNEGLLTNAIALSVHTAPLVGAAGSRAQMTGHIKEAVPFGVLSGITSALLAEQGYRGDPDAVESAGIYDCGHLTGHTQPVSAFSRTYFKRYTCCRLAHAPIDAAVAIMARERLHVSDVAGMTVRTFRAAIELPNEARPSSFESAQYSLPFCIAVALVDGIEALLPLSPGALEREDIVALAEKITLEHDARLDALYPAGTPTLVTIGTHGDAKFEEQRETADGDPGRPFADAQLLDKLSLLGRDKVSSTRLTAIRDCLQSGIPGPGGFEIALRERAYQSAVTI